MDKTPIHPKTNKRALTEAEWDVVRGFRGLPKVLIVLFTIIGAIFVLFSVLYVLFHFFWAVDTIANLVGV